MERATVEIYDQRGLEWAATHTTAGRRVEAEAFADRVGPGQVRLDVGCGAGRIKLFSLNPFDLRSNVMRETAVQQRLAQTLIGVLKRYILPHHTDANLTLRVAHVFEQR